MKNKRRILFAVLVLLVIVLGVAGVLILKRDKLVIGKKTTTINAQESKNTQIGEIVERNNIYAW